jgi:5,10-methenyltetrahydrofolate synthetase
VNSSQLKKKLRSELQNKIEQISFMDLITKSQNLSESFQKNIVDSANFNHFSAKYIISFYPFGSEPQINIESEKNDEPYRVGYVRIIDWNRREMVSAQARRDQPSQWEEFPVSESNKIFQPTQSQPICKPEEVAAILVPGLGFTIRGERLGRGAGFYDRFLKEYPNALRVGLAFQEQLIHQIPTDAWDEKVDVILTDQGIHEVIEMKLLGEWKSQGKINTRSI